MDFRIIFVSILLVVARSQSRDDDDNRVSVVQEADEEVTEVPEGGQENVFVECSLIFLTVLQSLVDGHNDPDNVCEALHAMNFCLEDKAKLSLDETESAELESELEELREILEEQCTAELENAEVCIRKESAYLKACINDETEQDINSSILIEDTDDDPLKCRIYRDIAECLMDRSEEKCGSAGRTFMAEEVSDYPPSIKKDCKQPIGLGLSTESSGELQ